MLDKADRASPPVERGVGYNSWHDCNVSGPLLGQVLRLEKDVSLSLLLYLGTHSTWYG
jgi:hypothetical protein